MPGSRIAVAVACLSLAACASTDPVGPKQEAGAVTGAIAGAAVGAAAAGGSTGSRVAGAAVGAVAGGIMGGAIGQSLDERDRQRAYAAEMQAMEYGEPGAPVGWRSDRSGRHGTVVPGAYYETRGTRCRDYSHTIYIDGRPQIARSTACRNPDGTWTPVG